LQIALREPLALDWKLRNKWQAMPLLFMIVYAPAIE
jgi:hypothetical protein